jgi:spore coat polysaccharide biosynthesis protein SpsF (cytidylyltransferase family)
MKSNRLTGKVLRPIMGRPMLELLVERCSSPETLDQIIVATDGQRF